MATTSESRSTASDDGHEIKEIIQYTYVQYAVKNIGSKMGDASPILFLQWNYLEKKMNDAPEKASFTFLVQDMSEMGSP